MNMNIGCTGRRAPLGSQLRDGKVIGAAEIRRADVCEEILPYLPYEPTDAGQLDKQRDNFRKIDGRKIA